MLACLSAWPDRVWAIEGCEGIGRRIAHRLLADDHANDPWGRHSYVVLTDAK